MKADAVGWEGASGPGRPSVRRGVASLCLLLLAAAPAAGQVPELDRIRSALPAPTFSRIEGVIESARREGIPTALLVEKVLEGTAKGVPEADLERALAEYAALLRRARTLVGPEADASTLETAAEAIRRGVPPAAIGGLARDHPARLDMLLTVFGDLLSAGIPPERAAGVVEQAARMEMEGDRLLQLPAAVRRRIREGASPGEAADALLEDLRRGRNPIPPGLQRLLDGLSEPGRSGGSVPDLRPLRLPRLL